MKYKLFNPCFNGILKYFDGEPKEHNQHCLNPCFNGILKYLIQDADRGRYQSLNPCFNGILKYVKCYRESDEPFQS